MFFRQLNVCFENHCRYGSQPRQFEDVQCAQVVWNAKVCEDIPLRNSPFTSYNPIIVVSNLDNDQNLENRKEERVRSNKINTLKEVKRRGNRESPYAVQRSLAN